MVDSQTNSEIPGFTPMKIPDEGGESHNLSHEKRAPGWLGYIGDYTTQLYGDYNKPL